MSKRILATKVYSKVDQIERSKYNFFFMQQLLKDIGLTLLHQLTLMMAEPSLLMLIRLLSFGKNTEVDCLAAITLKWSSTYNN
jgi:hypothetical protein